MSDKPEETEKKGFWEKMGESIKYSILSPVAEKFATPLKVLAGIAPIIIECAMGDNPFKDDVEKNKERKINKNLKQQERIEEKEEDNVDEKKSAMDSLSELTEQMRDASFSSADDRREQLESSKSSVELAQILALPPPIEPLLALPPPDYARAEDVSQLFSLPSDEFQKARTSSVVNSFRQAKASALDAQAQIDNGENLSFSLSNQIRESAENQMELEGQILSSLSNQIQANDEIISTALVEVKNQIADLEQRSINNDRLIAQGQQETAEVLSAKSDAMLEGEKTSFLDIAHRNERDEIQDQILAMTNRIGELDVNNELLEIQGNHNKNLLEKIKSKFEKALSPAEIIGRTVAAGLYALGSWLDTFKDLQQPKEDIWEEAEKDIKSKADENHMKFLEDYYGEDAEGLQAHLEEEEKWREAGFDTNSPDDYFEAGVQRIQENFDWDEQYQTSIREQEERVRKAQAKVDNASAKKKPKLQEKLDQEQADLAELKQQYEDYKKTVIINNTQVEPVKEIESPVAQSEIRDISRGGRI